MSEHQILFRDKPLLDASEQQAAQDWLPLEITQISPGAYEGRIREVRQGSVSVCFEQQNSMVHKRGVMNDDFCTVSFVRSLDAQSRFSEYNSIGNSLFLLPAGTEFDAQVAGGTETVYFRFKQSHLIERARGVNPMFWDTNPEKLYIFNANGRKSLDTYASILYTDPAFRSNSEVARDDRVLGGSILDQVVLALNSSSPGEDSHRDLVARRRARHMTRAFIEYVDAAMNSHSCPSIVDICIGLNVSQRNLQYNFRKILGLTPNTYLRRLRLNRVRAQLSKPANAEVTVTGVATHWHFWHLGRFANDYLRLFGELPSSTLRRALAS